MHLALLGYVHSATKKCFICSIFWLSLSFFSTIVAEINGDRINIYKKKETCNL